MSIDPPELGKTYWFVEAFKDDLGTQVTGIWLGKKGACVTRDPLQAMRFTTREEAAAYAEMMAKLEQHVFWSLCWWGETDHVFVKIGT